MTLHIPCGPKISLKSLSRTVSEITGFLCILRVYAACQRFTFYEKIQDGCQKWREHNFAKKWQMTLLILRGHNILSKF